MKKKRSWNFQDLTGQKFGRLTVLEEGKKRIKPSGQEKTMWLCECDCKNTTEVTTGDLKNKHTQSCGCLHKEIITKHGMHKSRQYIAWNSMISRCKYKDNSSFKNYGAKGIGVCDKWNTFEGFWEDMREGYADNLSIDRIDNNKGYFKENCRWATKTQQEQNKPGYIKRRKYSEYKGLEANNQKTNTWTVSITKDKSRIRIGNFHNEKEAAFVYDQLAMQLFGEYACTNFDYSV